ncbi:hypothetical protein QN277_014140 [Acacia crassicarpa]|uniref:F-box domain-containing protein n=1 Tax=Acacia crassicarpa TaxID=499986 RepID=A0AAE1N692_9FABA|nr:hypothetical protein QN277_014140 [Acacia crassicarpa]
MDPYPPPWSGLRRDLLLKIANLLDSSIDRLRFRGVCYRWRSVLPTPSRRSAPPYPPPWSGLRRDLLLKIANLLDGIDRLRFRGVCYRWRSVLPTPSRRSAPPYPPPWSRRSAPPYSPPWSGLRRDLLLKIANLLDGIDRLRFRGVCYRWRSVLPTPSRRSAPPSESLKLPFPMAPDPNLNQRRRGKFMLVHSTVYCLQTLYKITDTCKTTECWIIKIEETGEVGEVRLKDPLYRSAKSKALSPRLPKGLNLLDHRVSEITKVYDLQFVANNKKIPAAGCFELFSLRPTRVAVCSKGPDFAVMAIHSYGQLSIWKNDDQEWTSLSNGPGDFYYNDVVCHKGKFYALDYSGITISVDLSKEIAQVTPTLANHRSGDVNFYKRLVSYLGDLFLVDRDPRGSLAGENSDSDDDVLPTYFHVHRLNEDEREWVPVKSLGNTAMFVGEDCTFCVSTQEWDGCKKNCIYYLERFVSRDDANEYQVDREVALFDMEDCSAKLLSRVSDYSKLFWPPPSWVKVVDV